MLSLSNKDNVCLIKTPVYIMNNKLYHSFLLIACTIFCLGGIQYAYSEEIG